MKRVLCACIASAVLMLFAAGCNVTPNNPMNSPAVTVTPTDDILVPTGAEEWNSPKTPGPTSGPTT